jgi:alpha-galactosidase
MKQRKTPIMGWASWNCFRTNITEKTLKKQIDALIDTGLAEHGYTYFNMDDGFFGGRNEDGTLNIHKTRFPNGVKVIADYAHERGLKAGIYSDGGDNTCGYSYDNEGENGEGVGLYGHEQKDLNQYLVDWDFDFIKVDWCGGLRLGLDEEEQYTKIGRIIDDIRKRTGKSIVYNICRWQFPGEWAAEVADSWRTGADICVDFKSVLHQIDIIKPLRKFCKPGHVNDLDMLQIGNGMSDEEDKTHFILWCMMSTPLMIGCDLTKIKPETLKILTNDELIAVNQDSACLQAYVAKSVEDENGLQGEVWVKDLGKENSNKKAVALLNRSEEPVQITVSPKEIGLGGRMIGIRDLWRHEDMECCEEITVTILPHSCEVFKIAGEYATMIEIEDLTPDTANIQRITWDMAQDFMKEGAVLVDVRTQEEYETAHMDGAINLPYTDVHAVAEGTLSDKGKKIITCCATGKRSFQAAKSLAYLGYRDVCYVQMP